MRNHYRSPSGSQLAGEGWFGDGADGAVTISSDTTLAIVKRYTDLTINATKVLTPAGFPIYVSGTLTLEGAISSDGTAGAATGTKGLGHDREQIYYDVCSDGGAGGVGAGANGDALNQNEGSIGGAGGAGSGGAGGAGGVLGPNATQYRNWGNVFGGLLQGIVSGRWGDKAFAGGSGGGGGGGDGTAGGGGGGGGGVCVIVARRVIIGAAGRISANGGAGGSPGAGNRGGGGGGGGGVCVLVCSSLNDFTKITASGGAKGLKTGTGVDGANGVDGYAKAFVL